MTPPREPVARDANGAFMTQLNARATVARRDLGDVPTRLAALLEMTVGDLADLYLSLYGEPTRSRNRDYLRKRLAWRIQEMAEGGLSQRAIKRIAELGDNLPERWRMRQAAAEQPITPPPTDRDPRLPPVGAQLRRIYQGTPHDVTVVEDGFLYQGQRYRTLSAVAKLITGTAWNGFLFFGLTKPATVSDASSPAVSS